MVIISVECGDGVLSYWSSGLSVPQSRGSSCTAAVPLKIWHLLMFIAANLCSLDCDYGRPGLKPMVCSDPRWKTLSRTVVFCPAGPKNAPSWRQFQPCYHTTCITRVIALIGCMSTQMHVKAVEWTLAPPPWIQNQSGWWRVMLSYRGRCTCYHWLKLRFMRCQL